MNESRFSIDSLKKTFDQLVQMGNYEQARRYLGKMLRTIYTDMTGNSEKCLENARHDSVLLSLMESVISEASKIIGLNRFGAVFDLYRSAVLVGTSGSPSVLKTNGRDTDDDLSLKKKIQILKKNGCFAIYQSKVSSNDLE